MGSFPRRGMAGMPRSPMPPFRFWPAAAANGRAVEPSAVARSGVSVGPPGSRVAPAFQLPLSCPWVAPFLAAEGVKATQCQFHSLASVRKRLTPRALRRLWLFTLADTPTGSGQPVQTSHKTPIGGQAVQSGDQDADGNRRCAT